MALGGNGSTFLFIALGIVTIVGIVTMALAAATLGTLNKRHDDLQQQIHQLSNLLKNISSTIPTTTTTSTTTTTTISANITTDYTSVSSADTTTT